MRKHFGDSFEGSPVLAGRRVLAADASLSWRDICNIGAAGGGDLSQANPHLTINKKREGEGERVRESERGLQKKNPKSIQLT
jgi:hypothetical protein